jgi:hypothetical protein
VIDRLLAITALRTPARAAWSSTTNVADALPMNTSSGVPRSGAGMAARWMTVSTPAMALATRSTSPALPA